MPETRPSLPGYTLPQCPRTRMRPLSKESPALRGNLGLPLLPDRWPATSTRDLPAPQDRGHPPCAGARRAHPWTYGAPAATGSIGSPDKRSMTAATPRFLALEFPDAMAPRGFAWCWHRRGGIKFQEQESFAAATRRSPPPNRPARAAHHSAKAADEGSPDARAPPPIRDRQARSRARASRRPRAAEERSRRKKRRLVTRPPLAALPAHRAGRREHLAHASPSSRPAGKAGPRGVIVPTGIATDATTAPSSRT
jgi:hypothetical protein